MQYRSCKCRTLLATQSYCVPTTRLCQHRYKHTVPVVLVQQVDELGHRGMQMDVAAGFARNHLFPKKLAVHATDEHVQRFAVELSPEQFERNAALRRRRQLRQQASRAKLTFGQATEDGQKLYGRVAPQDFAEALFKASGLRVQSDRFSIVWDKCRPDGEGQQATTDDSSTAAVDDNSSNGESKHVDAITRTGSYVLRVEIEDGLFVEVPATVSSV